MSTLPPRETLDAAFFSRDPAWDGLFFAAVSSTGIFCRPTCPARKPRPDRVSYFGTAAEALFSGYRPCKRCKPLAAEGDPDWLAGLIERVEAEPRTRIRDSELREQGLDPAAVRRRFQARYGLSFQAYQRARRLAAAFESIREGGSIDEAVFDHGYESHSGFRDAFSKLFGAPPARAVRGSVRGNAHSSAPGGSPTTPEGRTGDFIRLAWVESPLGPLVAGATDRGICLLEFSDRRMLEAQGRILSARLGIPAAPGDSHHLRILQAQLAEYFAGHRRDFDIPLDEPGTPFQEKVWTELRRIPFGETRSYAQLATAIGDPAAVRAVARANGMNRIAILVPCHRVIGSDGGLGGYGGGVFRKRRLLQIEGALAGDAAPELSPRS